jgi:3',5'-cyclic AMP phosphodiesterase CpdA
MSAGGSLLIAQFSDLHITAPGAPLACGIDSAAGLRRCIAHLAALPRRPDLLLLSGDLVDRGEAEEYAALRALLADLRLPCLPLPGNHDRRERLRAAFALGGAGPLRQVRELGGLRLIALDTLVEGEDGGDLDDAQLDALAADLDAGPRQPALIALHHPPLASGFAEMDRIALAPRAARRLGDIVAARPAVQALLCGHLHRPLTARWQGSAVAVAPSTAFQARLRFGGGRFEPDPREPPAYLLHYWNGRSLVTHLATA